MPEIKKSKSGPLVPMEFWVFREVLKTQQQLERLKNTIEYVGVNIDRLFKESLIKNLPQKEVVRWARVRNLLAHASSLLDQTWKALEKTDRAYDPSDSENSATNK